MSYYCLKTFGFVIGLLPERVLSWLAWFIALLVFDVLRLRRSLMLRNIAQAASQTRWDKARQLTIARQSLYHFALTVFEFFYASRNIITSRMHFEGLENLQQALARGQGVYIVCCHMGNWEAMGGFMNLTVAPTHVIVKKVGSPSTDRFASEQRKKIGFRAILRKQKGDAFKAITKALKQNEVIGFVMDQARPKEPRLAFFGKPAKTNTSLAAIWQRRHAPVLCAYAVREGVNQHLIKITPDLSLPTSQDSDADILAHSQIFNEAVENMIKENPEQYFWLHDRWK